MYILCVPIYVEIKKYKAIGIDVCYQVHFDVVLRLCEASQGPLEGYRLCGTAHAAMVLDTWLAGEGARIVVSCCSWVPKLSPSLLTSLKFRFSQPKLALSTLN